MKFEITAKGLLDGISPARTVSTTDASKDFAGTGNLVLEASGEKLVVTANGGRLAVRVNVEFIPQTNDYKGVEGGRCVVRAADIVTALESFPHDAMLVVSLGDSQAKTAPEDADEKEKMFYEALAGSDLQISLKSDPDQIQTMPTIISEIQFPALPSTPRQSVTVSASSFVRGMKKVLFAGGFMESKPKFLYWVLRAGKESVRYVAGSGSRFAILDQEGNLSDVSDDTDILMPVAQSSIVLKAISSTSADNVVVNQYGDKIEFVVGHLTFIAMGLIEDIKWIDENSIYERKSLHRLVLAKKDIEFAMKGVVAAESDIDKKRSAIHVVTLSLDPSASKVVVSSDRTAKKSVRKIDVLAHNGPNDSVEFSAAATLLLDIVKECDSQNVQLEIESSSKPLVVRGHASNDVEEPEKLKNKHDSTGATEMFGMLISSRQKSS